MPIFTPYRYIAQVITLIAFILKVYKILKRSFYKDFGYKFDVLISVSSLVFDRGWGTFISLLLAIQIIFAS